MKNLTAKPLSEYNVELILDGGRNTGSFYEGLRFDKVFLDDYDELAQFCNWLDKEIGGCGPINIQELWSAFWNQSDEQSWRIINYWKSKFEALELSLSYTTD